MLINLFWEYLGKSFWCNDSIQPMVLKLLGTLEGAFKVQVCDYFYDNETLIYCSGCRYPHVADYEAPVVHCVHVLNFPNALKPEQG